MWPSGLKIQQCHLNDAGSLAWELLPDADKAKKQKLKKYQLSKLNSNFFFLAVSIASGSSQVRDQPVPRQRPEDCSDNANSLTH